MAPTALRGGSSARLLLPASRILMARLLLIVCGNLCPAPSPQAFLAFLPLHPTVVTFRPIHGFHPCLRTFVRPSIPKSLPLPLCPSFPVCPSRALPLAPCFSLPLSVSLPPFPLSPPPSPLSFPLNSSPDGNGCRAATSSTSSVPWPSNLSSSLWKLPHLTSR